MKRYPILFALAVVAVLAPRRPPPSEAGDSKPPSDTPPPPTGPVSPAGPIPTLPPPAHSTPAAKLPAPAPTPVPIPTPPTPAPIPEPIPVPPPPPVPTPVPAGPITQPKAGPHLKFERLSHDFGIAKQNADLKAAIVCTNVGTEPVHVTASGECTCAQATASKQTLEPGESGTIDLTFRTFTFVGKLKKHVRVMSDDADAPDVTIDVAVDVSAGMLIEPANFYFNTALVGASPTASVKVRYREGVGRPFRIKDVNVTGTGVADVVFASKPFVDDPWKGYEITMTFRAPPPIGPVRGDALIHTDDPDYASLKCQVGGNISGRVYLAQERTSVGMPPEGKEVVLKIGCRGFDDTIDIGVVTARSRKSVVAAKAVHDASDAKLWTIEITLPGTTPPGAVDDVVEVTTEVKGEEHLEINVGGTVVAKPR